MHVRGNALAISTKIVVFGVHEAGNSGRVYAFLARLISSKRQLVGVTPQSAGVPQGQERRDMWSRLWYGWTERWRRQRSRAGPWGPDNIGADSSSVSAHSLFSGPCLYCKLGSPSSIGMTMAVRYLEMGQALMAPDIFKLNTDAKEFEDTHNEYPSYDSNLAGLKTSIQEQLPALLVDLSNVAQALSDVEEAIDMRIWELMSATSGFPHYPKVCIRQGAAAFISASAKHLPAKGADPAIGARPVGKCDTTSALAFTSAIRRRNAVHQSFASRDGNKTHRSSARCSSWIALGRVEVRDIEESTLVEIHTTGTDSESLKPDYVLSAPEPTKVQQRSIGS
ncbi:hypothetical protein FIBSPDRAFT_1004012 [Athelia psychrophila]|uniref:Uncharacterized protein n=1 Tax=Athelia psychrophila TaxID=1759441 RepID=A0A167W5U0_9AGAM|nr:hypothetical protein FIBSPDRAFT_1004012 [Fibularhizoctonia sp. CBS 109695]